MEQSTYIMANTYGSGIYNASSYENSTTSTSTAGANSSKSGGVLTDTGFYVLVVVSIACLVIFVALIVRFWSRPKYQKLDE